MTKLYMKGIKISLDHTDDQGCLLIQKHLLRPGSFAFWSFLIVQVADQLLLMLVLVFSDRPGS